MPDSGTERHLTAMGPEGVERGAPDLAAMYSDIAFQTQVSEVMGCAVEPVQHSVERYVLNRLDGEGDTHGGHFDDYPIAATLLLSSPGALDTSAWVERWDGRRQPIALREGDCYLIRADETWHGVGPVAKGGRLAITFAFNIPGHTVEITDSAQLIYG